MAEHDESSGGDPAAEDQPAGDRRTRSDRRKGDRRRQDIPVEVDRRAGGDRRKASRRKRRGPNVYDLDEEEMEFVRAIQSFKEKTGRPFPTWSEVLGILRELGYRKP